MTTVVNVKKAELNKRGICDFEEWAQKPNSLYIGRNMNFYVKGTFKSKWANPFTVKKYGIQNCLVEYENYIRTTQLWNQLEEIDGKELGCWCCPNDCHGNILVKLLNEKKNKTQTTKKIPIKLKQK